MDETEGISLIPIADEMPDDPPAPVNDPWPKPESGEYTNNVLGSGQLAIVSLAELAGERSGEIRERPPARSPAEPRAPIPRHGVEGSDLLERGSPEIDEFTSIAPATAANPASVWIIAGSFIGVALVLLALGLLQFMDTTRPPPEDLVTPTASNIVLERPSTITTGQRLAAVAAPTSLANRAGRGLPNNKTAAPSATKEKWQEPPDIERRGSADATQADALSGSRFLPDWARAAGA